MNKNIIKTIKYITQSKGSVFSELPIRENIEDAFENAIKKGMNNPDEGMYMYSENGKDYFKNECTRAYVSYRQYSLMLYIEIIFKVIVNKMKGKDLYE